MNPNKRVMGYRVRGFRGGGIEESSEIPGKRFKRDDIPLKGLIPCGELRGFQNGTEVLRSKL